MSTQQQSKSVKTTCPYCGVGCGVAIKTDKQGKAHVSGDKSHPANVGKLCSKGLALGQTLSLEGRLLSPEIDGRACDWNEATDLIASNLEKTIREHGPESVAFYVSGQLLTEDYYAVNKLVKGYIGTANIDTNSRLCMASSVAGHKRAFGSDTVPGLYSDIESANLIILTGSNLAWCHPILQQRISAAKKSNRNLKVIVIDPRRTATAELADIHLAIKPDTDAAVFNGLLSYIVDNKRVDRAYVKSHTSGFNDAIASAKAHTIEQLSNVCGLSVDQLHLFFNEFLSTSRVVTFYSQGVNQSSAGTDTVNSIINCHLVTGRIGKRGMGPFSVTGQPNAMGGREVGGLSNMLAAHMDLDSFQHQHLVQQFWRSPEIAKQAGLKAVDLFKAVRDKKIKFLWIMATNPAVSMPDADGVKSALANCEFVVVSDVVSSNDTLEFADVKLPAAAWGEKDGTVTNSERRISRQRAFRSLPAKVKPDWWAVCEVAKKLGHRDAFSFKSSADIFREHAALSGYRNEGTRDFDISAYEGVSNVEYDELEPFVWPRPRGASVDNNYRFFANGNYYTKDKRARIIPIVPIAYAEEKSSTDLMDDLVEGFADDLTDDSKKVSLADQFIMNTGRVRDQWHTMSRTGFISKLSAHYAEPFIEIHTEDAQKIGLKAKDIVRVYNADSSVLLRAVLCEKQQRGSVFTPMHWTNTHASLARVNALVPNKVDAVSGQPASKSALVNIEKFHAVSYSFAVVRDWHLAERVIRRQQDAQSNIPLYWSRSVCEQGWRVEIASYFSPEQSTQFWHHELVATKQAVLEMDDKKNAIHRLACYKKNELFAAVFTGAEPISSSRPWVSEQLGRPVDASMRYRVMAGRAAGAESDNGEIVCSCYMVGQEKIERCIAGNECSSVAEIGRLVQAGTNCGSCRGELQLLLNKRLESVKSINTDTGKVAMSH